ncbi:MAG: type II toxin-antitoxin system VapC family toxin [Leptospirales bacterium]
MKILLDTHIFLWCASDPERLPDRARALILDPKSQIHVSAASIWEMAIKQSICRLELDFDLGTLDGMLTQNGFFPLPVEIRHAALVQRLPFHHKDPFDRILVAQALGDPMYLLTSDPLLKPYGEMILLVPTERSPQSSRRKR